MGAVQGAGLPLPLKAQRNAPGLTENVRAGTEARAMRSAESPWSALLSALNTHWGCVPSRSLKKILMLRREKYC